VRALPDGFSAHLRDAIALNRARRPFYTAHGGWQARRVSRVLVAAERALLPLAWAFDVWAARYERAGVPVMTALFVPMTGLPAPRMGPAPVEPFAPLPVGPMRQAVGQAYQRGGFEAAAGVLAAALGALPPGPFHAMRRHLLESAHRLCTVAPAMAVQARAAGLPDPDPMHGRLLQLHLAGLAFSALLDTWAAPAQARGVPVLAADLPPIPAHPAPDGA
jgi:hypothetical protein